jgi:hypothetical protein
MYGLWSESGHAVRADDNSFVITTLTAGSVRDSDGRKGPARTVQAP